MHTVFFQNASSSITEMKMLVGRNMLKGAHSQHGGLTLISPYKIKPERLASFNNYIVTIKIPMLNTVEKVRAVKE